ncbi:hypothetical protein H4R35_007119, partial [Dimargaris xerosporica]
MPSLTRLDLVPNPQLLHPSFEGYKLRQWPPRALPVDASPFHCVCLPDSRTAALPAITNIAASNSLSFQELSVRIKHNALYALPSPRDLGLNSTMDASGRCLAFATASGSISASPGPQLNAVPSLVHAGSGYMLYLHGPALLDVLQLVYPHPDGSNQALPLPRLQRVARYTAHLGGLWPATSFQLAAAIIVGHTSGSGTIKYSKHPVAIRAVLHCRALYTAGGPSSSFRREFVPEGRVPYGPARPPGATALSSSTSELGNRDAHGHRSDLPTTFYTALVDLDLEEQAPASPLTPKHCVLRHLLTSTTIPQCVWFAPSGEQYCMATTPAPITVLFQLTGTEAQVVPTVASPNASPISAPQANATTTTKAPYIWMQTETDVTVCYELPERTDASQLSCTLSRMSVTLSFAPMLTEHLPQFPALN